MTIPTTPHLSRRRFLTAVALSLGGATAWSTAAPGVAVAGPGSGSYTWTRSTTANGWTVIEQAPMVLVQGSRQAFAVRGGDVATVLQHVVRRFHYELDQLRPGDLSGHTTVREVRVDYESNYLSGTAVAVRANQYPLGISGGLYEWEQVVIDDILTECRGVVAWGGVAAVPKQSHFEIAMGPDDPRVGQLARTIRSWTAAPGRGAGAVDASEPARQAAAQSFDIPVPR